MNSFQRMTVPGTATVHITQSATRVLYYESTIAVFLVGTGAGLTLIITAVRRFSARRLAAAPR